MLGKLLAGKDVLRTEKGTMKASGGNNNMHENL